MFTECTVNEIIEEMELRKIKEVVLSERGSLLYNGMKFKVNSLSFYIPSEKEFFKLTAHPDATPITNFGERDKQYFSIRTKYGLVTFFNKRVDIDRNCNWDITSKVYFFHEGYLLKNYSKNLI